MTGTNQTAHAAYVEWTEHRFYAYRGCAPDPDEPRLAAGSVVRDGERVRVPLDAWSGGEDRDGGESQRARRVREADALEVCLNCPVMVACDAYANSVTGDGRLAEPDGIRGGRTALERKRLFHRSERPTVVVKAMAGAVPPSRLETAQKLAVLRALALCWDPFEVASAAGVTVRTANWQRSKIVTDMGLPKSASRERMLAVAVELGLVDGSLVVRDGGSVPAVPPPTAVGGQAAEPFPVPSPPLPEAPAVSMSSPEHAGDRVVGPLRLQSPRRDRFADVVGQLALWEAELATVHVLPRPARVESLRTAV